MKMINEASFPIKSWIKEITYRKHSRKLKINFQIKSKQIQRIIFHITFYFRVVCAKKILFKNIPKHIMEKINFYRHGKCVI